MNIIYFQLGPLWNNRKPASPDAPSLLSNLRKQEPVFLPMDALMILFFTGTVQADFWSWGFDRKGQFSLNLLTE
jgi:hypothetical protein